VGRPAMLHQRNWSLLFQPRVGSCFVTLPSLAITVNPGDELRTTMVEHRYGLIRNKGKSGPLGHKRPSSRRFKRRSRKMKAPMKVEEGVWEMSSATTRVKARGVRRKRPRSKRSNGTGGKHRNDQHAGGDNFAARSPGVCRSRHQERGHRKQIIGEMGMRTPINGHQAEQ